jgi:hypothetical protein
MFDRLETEEMGRWKTAGPHAPSGRTEHEPLLVPTHRLRIAGIGNDEFALETF